MKRPTVHQWWPNVAKAATRARAAPNIRRVFREGTRTGRTLPATSLPDALGPISPSATTLLIENSRLTRSSRFRGAGETLAYLLAGGGPRNERKTGARYGSAGYAIDD